VVRLLHADQVVRRLGMSWMGYLVKAVLEVEDRLRTETLDFTCAVLGVVLKASSMSASKRLAVAPRSRRVWSPWHAKVISPILLRCRCASRRA
jgi:hypothetical protein